MAMFRWTRRTLVCTLTVALGALTMTAGQGPAPVNGTPSSTVRLFDFGPGAVAAGAQQVLATTTYTRQRGYGFLETSGIECVDRRRPDPGRGGFCTSAAPFRLVVDLPEGNYRVTVTLGDADGDSMTTVRAESRRLMLEHIATSAGGVVTRSFIVNIRNSRLAAGGRVALKGRELGVAHWDDALTLEFGDRGRTRRGHGVPGRGLDGDGSNGRAMERVGPDAAALLRG
jgi:hypothetical protein